MAVRGILRETPRNAAAPMTAALSDDMAGKKVFHAAAAAKAMVLPEHSWSGGNQPAVCACGECEQDDEPFDGGQLKAVLPVGQSAKGQLIACLPLPNSGTKWNYADECKHTDGQGNDFDIVALNEGELLGGTLEKDGGCAQYRADDGGKPKVMRC